jgi:hypothetical protein
MSRIMASRISAARLVSTIKPKTLPEKAVSFLPVPFFMAFLLNRMARIPGGISNNSVYDGDIMNNMAAIPKNREILAIKFGFRYLTPWKILFTRGAIERFIFLTISFLLRFVRLAGEAG